MVSQRWHSEQNEILYPGKGNSTCRIDHIKQEGHNKPELNEEVSRDIMKILKPQ